MNSKSLNLLLLVCVFALTQTHIACKKEVKSENHNCSQGQHWDAALQKCVDDLVSGNDTAEAFLTPEEDSILASLPDTSFKPSEIYFPDGENFEDYANYNDSTLISNWGNKPIGGTGTNSIDPYKTFLEKLFKKATYYTNASKFDKPDEGENKPKQYGLAYVSSDDNTECQYDRRFKNGKCSNFLYGFECNGFVSRLFIDAGLIKKYRVETGKLAIPETYNNLFSKTTDYKELKYEDRGKMSILDMQTGDIIYFKHPDGKIFHIGIVSRIGEPFFSPSSIYIYQSNGSPDLSVPAKNKDGQIIKDNNGNIVYEKKGCEFNTREFNRGPRCVPLAKFVNTRIKKKDANGNIFYDYLFSDYYVLKLIGSSNQILGIIDATNNQTGEVGKKLSNPLRVKVTSSNGDPLKGVTVYFTATNSADKIDNVINPTNTDGIASVNWTLIDIVGVHSLNATIKDKDNNEIDKVTFTATATAPICDGFDVTGWWNSLDQSIQKVFNEVIGKTGTSLPVSTDLQSLFNLQTLHLENKSLKGNLTFPPCFKNLVNIFCQDNQLTSLDVSSVSNLSQLTCWTNSLNTLNVQGLTNLQHLACSSNNLNSLDLSGCTRLNSLFCTSNKLTRLDLSAFSNMIQIFCENNQISDLNVVGLGKLKTLACSSNQLNNINISGCNSLTDLNASRNNISDLDLNDVPNLQILDLMFNQLANLNVTNLKNLTYLRCHTNQLESLDLGGLTWLQTVYCDHNQIQNLNAKNLKSLQILQCNANVLGYNNLLKVMQDISASVNLIWGQCSDNNISFSNGPDSNNSFKGSDCDKITEYYNSKF